MDERLQVFFKGVSTAMTSNTLDIIILLTVMCVSVAVLLYVYYLYPKYTEYVYRRKLLYYFTKRYMLKSYELQSLDEVVRKHSIVPEHLIFTSRATFEAHEKDILRALKNLCPENVEAADALASLKERMND
ncbi:MAG: hypothetical protein ACD_47C00494G0002 [uncultured bacterium]|uniref:Uncharacterized protein n=1 Tax=Candidatus Wallbacteria bacterium GWC2_49_35 TaxID=1817813 RepID=A0A1F7WJ64_9BACT|nr:MAG: hypothetical protein ACD_47C00494G0002 [uncultured bacterium]OGM02840.1 MAG: hypothetical protein A2008_10400 [Candidatus Wallbacteria bacterium GWC2_49_35]HBC74441.1 hypothetical protein [Candidatus Wallbacteria bacterium]